MGKRLSKKGKTILLIGFFSLTLFFLTYGFFKSLRIIGTGFLLFFLTGFLLNSVLGDKLEAWLKILLAFPLSLMIFTTGTLVLNLYPRGITPLNVLIGLTTFSALLIFFLVYSKGLNFAKDEMLKIKNVAKKYSGLIVIVLIALVILINLPVVKRAGQEASAFYLKENDGLLENSVLKEGSKNQITVGFEGFDLKEPKIEILLDEKLLETFTPENDQTWVGDIPFFLKDFSKPNARLIIELKENGTTIRKLSIPVTINEAE